MINVTSLTSTTSLIANPRQSVFASLVMCYPSTFSAVHAGIVSVFLLPSPQEAPQLIGAPKLLLYVNNVVCATKCVITGSGISVGEYFDSVFFQSVSVTRFLQQLPVSSRAFGSKVMMQLEMESSFLQFWHCFF